MCVCVWLTVCLWLCVWVCALPSGEQACRKNKQADCQRGGGSQGGSITFPSVFPVGMAPPIAFWFIFPSNPITLPSRPSITNLRIPLFVYSPFSFLAFCETSFWFHCEHCFLMGPPVLSIRTLRRSPISSRLITRWSWPRRTCVWRDGTGEQPNSQVIHTCRQLPKCWFVHNIFLCITVWAY